MIKAALTDLGNVVVWFDRRRVAESIARLCGDADAESAIHQRLNMTTEGVDLLHSFESGQITKEEYQSGVERCLGVSLPSDRFWEAHCDMFQRNEAVIQLWKRLKRSHPHIPLIAVTDTDSVRLPWMIRLSGLPFDGAVTSYDVGVRKPDQKMFTAAIDKAGCRAGDCFFVDDVESNVAAAARLGIVAYYYNLRSSYFDEGLRAALAMHLR